MLAGAAGSFLAVSAAANFTAEATITSVASQQHAANVPLLAGAEAIWVASGQQDASGIFTSSATWSGDAYRNLGGVLPMEAFVTFEGFALRTVEGVWDQEASAELTAVVDAQLGTTEWTADLTFEADGTLIAKGSGSLLVSANWVTNELPVTRGATADWESTNNIFIEPTTESGGVIYHSGYVFLDATATFSEDPTKTVLVVGPTDFIAGATLTINPSTDGAAEGGWTNTTNLFIKPSLVLRGTVSGTSTATISIEPTQRPGAAQSLVAGVSWNGGANVKQVAKGTLTAGSTFILDSKMTYAGKTNWTILNGFSGVGVRRRMAHQAFTGTATLVVKSTGFVPATINWEGDATLAIVGAELLPVLAPDERQLKMSTWASGAKLSNGKRKLRLSE